MVHLELESPARRRDVEALYLSHRYRARQMLLAAAFATAGMLAVAAVMVVGV